MSWENPVTTWGHAGQTVPRAGDFNRIEGNIQHLQDTKETPTGAQAKANAAFAFASAVAGAVQAELDEHTAEKATQENLGHVKVDGETITASNGIISAQIEDIVTSDKWKWGMEDGIVFLERVVV
jgi:hypothetical protein